MEVALAGGSGQWQERREFLRGDVSFTSPRLCEHRDVGPRARPTEKVLRSHEVSHPRASCKWKRALSWGRPPLNSLCALLRAGDMEKGFQGAAHRGGDGADPDTAGGRWVLSEGGRMARHRESGALRGPSLLSSHSLASGVFPNTSDSEASA